MTFHTEFSWPPKTLSTVPPTSGIEALVYAAGSFAHRRHGCCSDRTLREPLRGADASRWGAGALATLAWTDSSERDGRNEWWPHCRCFVIIIDAAISTSTPAAEHVICRCSVPDIARPLP